MSSNPPIDGRSGLPAEFLGSELEFLRSVLASSADCIKVLDLDGRLVYMTEAGQKLMEVSDFNAIAGRSWVDNWHGSLKAEAEAAFASACGGGEGRFAGMRDTFAGNPRWWDVRVTPIRSALGKPEGVLVVSRDITPLKNAEAQQRLLTQELAHRVKNILAVVQALASLSLRDGCDMMQGLDTFNARLFALARAQDVLLKHPEPYSATVFGLLSPILAIHGNPEQITLCGPEIVLGSALAISFSLVMHELYTNALKYGALTRAQGAVAISWQLSNHEGEQHFELAWVESGGPVVNAPAVRGFGSRLIESSFAIEPSASARLAYEPDGVRFHLKINMRHVSDRLAGS